MTTRKVVLPIAALMIATGSSSTASAQGAGERHHNQQNHQSSRSRDNGSSRQHDSSSARQRDNGSSSSSSRQNDGGSSVRQRDNNDNANNDQRAEARRNRDQSQTQSQDQNRSRANDNRRDDNRSNDNRRDNDRARSYDRNRYEGRSYNRDDRRSSIRSDWYRGNYSRGYNGYSRGYYAPRIITRSYYSPHHYYGSGGRLSLYFNIGSGYMYGSPYYGRVYGYRRGIATYGEYVSYGDIKLHDFPRDAEVYVDGYYAGVVDDFDGFLQHLTLEVGPHEIEISGRGFEPQSFDVYVDPYNTVDLHGDFRR